ncbi:serine/threonine-protein kinase [Massilia sp. S19_KUP03_FR1]|uniref:serine/threonine-protein kinase n=1 Tax=Massilia sp. S19_KUP03_FR1 TaxID=3025503 RepID=UPI002FCD7C00
MKTAGTRPNTHAPDLAHASENCLPIGTRLKDFEIVGVLGEGGFGIVYLAFDRALRRTIAIKEFMPSVLAMRGADGAVIPRAERHKNTFRSGLKSFINEARLLAQFDHPGLVKIHRYWEQNGTAYTAMQYYEGRTIKDIVSHSPELINQAWCLKMLAQVLQALEILGTMQIVHRDVSPDNIIVQDNGEAVLLDFGSAREIIGDMTRAVTVILKPGYAPVEQYANDTSLEQGAYTDIYALCAVVYFAITRKAPSSSIARMVQDPMVPLAKLAPGGYKHAFLAAIDQGLAVLAEERPRSIAAFRTLLGIAPVDVTALRPAAATKRFAPAPAAGAALAPGVVTAPPVVKKTQRKTLIVPKTSPFAPEVVLTPTRSHKLARLGALVGTLAAVLACALAFEWQARRQDEAIKLAASAPRRTVVSAKQLLETEEILPVTAATMAMAVPTPPEPAAAPAVPDAVPAETVVAQNAAAPDPVPAVVMVPVTLAVKPWGTVFIDGRERGASPPLKRLMLPPGPHEIRIVNPVYPAYTTSIIVKKNGPASVEHDFGPAPQ